MNKIKILYEEIRTEYQFTYYNLIYYFISSYYIN